MNLAPLPVGSVDRVVLLGTPDMAVSTAEALVAAGIVVDHVVTRVDKRRGRGGSLSPSPLKAWAIDRGIPVSHRAADLLELSPAPRIGVVVAYGELIKSDVLARVPLVNLHYSLLPRWRGAAPVERCILALDTESGVDLMRIEEGLDTGDVFDERRVAVDPFRTTAAELRDRLVPLGAEMLIENLRRGLGVPRPQEGEASHAAKISADDLRLRFSAPIMDVLARVRVGGAWCEFRGRRLKVLRAEIVSGPSSGSSVGYSVGSSVGPSFGPAGTCRVGREGVEVAVADGVLRLLEVQPEGKPVMDASAWARGSRPDVLA